MNKKILYVEDEPDLAHVTRQYLELMDFSVEWCASGAAAVQLYQKNLTNYDFVIIDVQLPGMDGFEVAEQIRKWNKDACFLFLTARKEKADRIKGLKTGAIDYIVKPFDIDELVLKIRNITRHQFSQLHKADPVPHILQIGDICLNKNRLELSVAGGIAIALTQREAELLMYLNAKQNTITKRKEILLHIWGESDYFLGRSLDVFISRLRKVLVASTKVKITNVYGVGFIFSVTGIDT